MISSNIDYEKPLYLKESKEDSFGNLPQVLQKEETAFP